MSKAEWNYLFKFVVVLICGYFTFQYIYELKILEPYNGLAFFIVFPILGLLLWNFMERQDQRR